MDDGLRGFGPRFRKRPHILVQLIGDGSRGHDLVLVTDVNLKLHPNRDPCAKSRGQFAAEAMKKCSV